MWTCVVDPSLELLQSTVRVVVVCVGVGEKVGRQYRKGERGLEMNCGDRAQPDNKSLLPSVSVSECQCV